MYVCVFLYSEQTRGPILCGHESPLGGIKSVIKLKYVMQLVAFTDCLKNGLFGSFICMFAFRF